MSQFLRLVTIVVTIFVHPALAKLIFSVNEKWKPKSSAPEIQYVRPKPLLSKQLITDSSRYAVKSMPGLQKSKFTTKHWAGFIPIPYAGQDPYGQIFHWLFEPPVDTPDNPKPLLIWLNGGPGCSSMDGLFVENGPFQVADADGNIEINKYSWHNHAYLLFIDQPIGTGFSTVNTADCPWCDYVQNQSAVNSHIYSTLQSILRIYPFLQHRDIVFSGESYAGHYIPSMVDYITHLRKDASAHHEYDLHVTGLAIGNGWSDPEEQFNFGQFAHNIGLISGQEEQALSVKYALCKGQEESGDVTGQNACSEILGAVIASSGDCPGILSDDDTISSNGNITNSTPGHCNGPTVNYYDIRSYYVNTGTEWPEPIPRTVVYLNRDDVREAIHVSSSSQQFLECNPAGHYLQLMDGLGVVREIVNVLESKIPILFYNGQFDLICNHLGTEMLLNKLDWKGSKDFINADGGIWGLRNNKGELVPGGYSKATPDGLLTFLVVIGGSHMVPMDVPAAAEDMIQRFLTKKNFMDVAQPKACDSMIPHNAMMSGSAAGRIVGTTVQFSLTQLVVYTLAVMCVTGFVAVLVMAAASSVKTGSEGGEADAHSIELSTTSSRKTFKGSEYAALRRLSTPAALSEEGMTQEQANDSLKNQTSHVGSALTGQRNSDYAVIP